MTDSDCARDHALRIRLGEYLGEHCLKLTDQFASAVRDGDSGSIHKCRVSLRRQRSVLRQFRQLLPRRRRRKADRALRALARALAPIRDLDALGERLADDALAPVRAAPPAGAAGPAPAESLRAAMLAERATRLAALHGAGAPALLGRVLVHASSVAAECEDGDPDQCLQLVADRFLSASDALLPLAQDPEHIEPQHRLRIHIKRLRYACELLDPVIQGGLAEEIRLAESAQEQLGLLHDLATLAGLARRLVPQSPELGDQMDAMRLAEHARFRAGPGIDAGLAARLRARSITQEAVS